VRRLRPRVAFGLTTLDLSRCGLRGGEAAHLVALLIACPPLATLRLDGNRLADDGLRALVDACLDNDDVAPLCLSMRDCAMTWRAGAALAQLAQRADRLDTLLLDGNELGARGAVALARGIDGGAGEGAVLRRMAHNANAGGGGALQPPRHAPVTRRIAPQSLRRLSVRQCSLAAGASALAAAAACLAELSIDLADASTFARIVVDDDDEDKHDASAITTTTTTTTASDINGGESDASSASQSAAAHDGTELVSARLALVHALSATLAAPRFDTADTDTKHETTSSTATPVAGYSLGSLLGGWWGSNNDTTSPSSSLAAAPPLRSSLESLSLSVSGLQGIGITKLSQALSQNHSLIELHLVQ
jgi:hypothetical protein